MYCIEKKLSNKKKIVQYFLILSILPLLFSDFLPFFTQDLGSYQLFGNNSLNQCCLFVCGLWAIWLVRNRCIHERKKVTTLETTGFVRSYLRELDGLKVVLPIKPKVEELWKPPKSPFVKINFDVTFRKDEHKSCSGIVVRDSEGMVLGSRVFHNGWVPLVFAVEATVCSQGLQMGLDLGAIAVRVEGDALSVIKKLQKVEEDKSEISATIKVCLWSSKGFQMCKFVNGKRSKKECVKLLMGIVLISVLMKLGEGKSFGKWKG